MIISMGIFPIPCHPQNRLFLALLYRISIIVPKTITISEWHSGRTDFLFIRVVSEDKTSDFPLIRSNLEQEMLENIMEIALLQ